MMYSSGHCDVIRKRGEEKKGKGGGGRKRRRRNRVEKKREEMRILKRVTEIEEES